MRLERPATDPDRPSRPGVPGWAAATLLAVCLFAPYGTFALGGGTLRIDHLAVYLAFIGLWAAGRIDAPPPLAVGLFVFAALSVVATFFSPDELFRAPLPALKFLDGLLRGPIVLTIASSVRADPDRHRVVGLLAPIAVVLAGMAIVESVLPMEHPLVHAISRAYGGEAYVEGVLAPTGMNHKEAMLTASRASAVFMTPPSLSFAAIFLLVVAGLPVTRRGRGWRATVLVAALVCGFLSRSKSFALGVPVLLALNVVAGRVRGRGFLVVLASAAALAIGLQVFSEQPTGPLAAVIGASDPLEALTAGRFTRDRSLFEEAAAVLDDAPLLGYGLVQRADRLYADSGINKLLLHAGLLGLLAVAFGIAGQFVWMHRWRAASDWSAVGAQTLLVGLSFFLAGALFQMPRINDLFFTLQGLSIGALRASSSILDGTSIVPSSAPGVPAWKRPRIRDVAGVR